MILFRQHRLRFPPEAVEPVLSASLDIIAFVPLCHDLLAQQRHNVAAHIGLSAFQELIKAVVQSPCAEIQQSLVFLRTFVQPELWIFGSGIIGEDLLQKVFHGGIGGAVLDDIVPGLLQILFIKLGTVCAVIFPKEFCCFTGEFILNIT